MVENKVKVQSFVLIIKWVGILEKKLCTLTQNTSMRGQQPPTIIF